jgi:PAS domain S-box-containing protein
VMGPKWSSHPIFDSLSPYIGVLDETGRVVIINKAWRDSADPDSPLAYNVSEGIDYLALCDRVGGEGFEQAVTLAAGIRAVIREEQSDFSLEYSYLSPCGQRWFMGRVARFFDEGLLRLLISHEDITERKRTEEALMQSEERYRLLFERNLAGIFRSTVDGRILDCNESFVRLLGYDSKEDLLSYKSWDLYPERNSRSDYISHLEEQQLLTNYEVCLKRKDGSLVWVLENVNLLPGKNGDKIIEGALIDITERKQTEEALKQSQKWLATIFEASLDGIVVEENEYIVYANRSFAHLYGYDRPEDLMGRHVSIVQAAQDNERMLEFGRKRLRGEPTPSTYEFKGRKKDGTIIDLEASVSTSVIAGRDYIITVLHDITERKNAEERIKASLKEKEVLLKEIHHRVKNNLQVISSLLNLQAGYIKDRRALEMFKESQNRIRSMALIHEKLYQSKDLARIDFTEYIRNLMTYLFRLYEADTDSIRLKIDTNGVLLAIDTAIPCGLIVNELVSNSLKYAFPQKRKGEISISLHSDGSRFTLTVSDSGIGFPDDLDFRNTESLGLQLVTGLTAQLDGTVELLNSNGTIFKIAFPEQKGVNEK